MAKENMKPQRRSDTVPGTPASIRASRAAVRGTIQSTPNPAAADGEDERETIPVPNGRIARSHERLAATSEPVEPRGEKRDPRREDEDEA